MTDSTISIPSYNPTELQNMAGLLDFFQRIMFMKLEKVAPAQILSYDRNTNRASVQILNYSITSTGEKISRKPLNDIPVQIFGGGGYCLGFPIKQGDIGILIAADCDISVWKKLLQLFAPATYQKHKYKNGIFFPLIINGFTFSNDDENAVLLTSVDGNTKIGLKTNSIEIKATNINITGALTINSQPYLNHTHSNGNEGSPTGGVII